MTDNTYRIKKGEKKPITIKITKTDSDTGVTNPVDLTGSTIKFQIKDELSDEIYIVDKTITEETDISTVGKITDPTNGVVITKITDEDYSLLTPERVYYLVIWWVKDSEDFSAVISGDCGTNLRFIVCYP